MFVNAHTPYTILKVGVLLDHAWCITMLRFASSSLNIL